MKLRERGFRAEMRSPTCSPRDQGHGESKSALHWVLDVGAERGPAARKDSGPENLAASASSDPEYCACRAKRVLADDDILLGSCPCHRQVA